jgi:hypothetical protein
MTDFKQLCAELVDDLEMADWPWKLKESFRADIQRARAALAEPEPQRRYIYSPVQIAECGGPCEQGPEHCDCGELWVTEPEPTDRELEEEFGRALLKLPGDSMNATAVAFARAALARWGNSAPQPIPVSERLPGPGDCDAEGRCWWYGEGEDMTGWTYQDSEGLSYYRSTHWLPAHALPQPDTEPTCP